MPGTSESAKRAAITKKKRYGEDYFHRLGRLGGNPLLIAQGKMKHDQQ